MYSNGSYVGTGYHTGNIGTNPTFSGTLNGGSFSAGASNSFSFFGRSVISSPTDGNLQLTNNAGTSFGLLQFGGTTNAFPALKANGTQIQLRTADDSSYAQFACSGVFASGGYSFNGFGSINQSGDGIFTLVNNAGTSFARLNFGGTTTSFPALQRSGAALQVTAGDGSIFLPILASYFKFGVNSTSIQEAADGVLTLFNAAGTDFTRLNFGGTSSLFPAIFKVNGGALAFKTADNAGYIQSYAAGFNATGAAVSVAAGVVCYGGTTATTIGANGAASALTALPVGYIICNVAGTQMKIPYYNN